MSEVLGIDGARSGWVAVHLVDGAFSDCILSSTLADILAAHSEADAIAIDIPIGLPEIGIRSADVAARVFVGPRRSSVFAVPPLRVLEVGDYAEATALSRQLTGKGIPRQAYALREKIFEADEIASDPRVWEVHPEVSFRAIKGSTLECSKKTWNGHNERTRLLADVGIHLPDELPCGTVAPDDLLDAAAAAWSARRIARGEAGALPEGRNDGAARRAAVIWY